MAAETRERNPNQGVTSADTSAAVERWPLLQRFPGLAGTLAPLPLCDLPTPVQALPDLHPLAWVKRDDVTHTEYGGNKARKFEVIASELRRDHAREVYTLGARGTNHGVATALFCRELELSATVITFPQADSKVVRRNQQRMHEYGARVINTDSIYQAAALFYLHPHRLRKGHYFLAPGGSTTAATLAYANAALELQQQIAQGHCPEPGEIYVPAGTCSTWAGLALGCALAGLRTRVVGVQIMSARVGLTQVCTPAVGRRMVRDALALIRQQDPQFQLDIPDMTLNPHWYAPGYGQWTEPVDRAIQRGEDHGLTLEQTYSGRCFAAFLECLEAADRPVLYWATYNSRSGP